MTRKTLIIVIDGCALDYITKEHTPNLYRLGEAGFFKTVQSAMPSVTNVNHASILSGTLPKDHGIVGNYFYHRESRNEGFIEASHHMKGESIIDIYHKQGKSTALLTVKGKVLEVFGKNAQIGINLQKMDTSDLEKLSLPTPPDVGSLDTYEWIFKACYQVININNPDLVYCTTNDYMMHNYPPESEEAKVVMGTIDKWLGLIYDLDPEREIYITADHGMNAKSHLVDMQKKLDNAGFDTYCLLPLKDRYLENHRYQEGGAVYIYILNPEQINEVREYLEKCNFIDQILSNTAAGDLFGLPADNIGDIVALTSKYSAFAELAEEELLVNTRTHGSLYERNIPLVAVNPRQEADYYNHSIDIVRGILNI